MDRVPLDRTAGAFFFEVLHYHAAETVERLERISGLEDKELKNAYREAVRIGVGIGSAVLVAASEFRPMYEKDEADRSALKKVMDALVAEMRARSPEMLATLVDEARMAYPALNDERTYNAIGFDMGKAQEPAQAVPEQRFPV